VYAADDSRGDGVLADWPARVAENLTGRRILERVPHGVEAEPATLAQVATAARLPEVLSRLRGRPHPLAEAADRAAGEILHGLVATLATRPDLRVHAWPEGQRVIGGLADVLEQLDAIAAVATSPTPALDAGESPAAV
jgi:hypothetical protein